MQEAVGNVSLDHHSFDAYSPLPHDFDLTSRVDIRGWIATHQNEVGPQAGTCFFSVLNSDSG